MGSDLIKHQCSSQKCHQTKHRFGHFFFLPVLIKCRCYPRGGQIMTTDLVTVFVFATCSDLPGLQFESVSCWAALKNRQPGSPNNPFTSDRLFVKEGNQPRMFSSRNDESSRHVNACRFVLVFLWRSVVSLSGLEIVVKLVDWTLSHKSETCSCCYWSADCNSGGAEQCAHLKMVVFLLLCCSVVKKFWYSNKGLRFPPWHVLYFVFVCVVAFAFCSSLLHNQTWKTSSKQT